MGPFDASGAFRGGVAQQHLRSAATRGAGATVLSGVLSLGVQMGGTVVLARLLTPNDFGLVTMVTTFSLLLLNFGLNGITEAVVQRQEMTHALASNLFWINAVASGLLALIFAASGAWLARLYHDPRVTGVAAAIALTILITGLQVVPVALLKRAMRFTAAGANDLISRAAAVVVSIAFALKGSGYWSLVAGAIAMPFSAGVGGWMLCRWLPGLPRRAAGTKDAVKFAANIYGHFATGYLTNNFDNFLVGWRLGPVPLGYYKKAYDLFVLSTNQLSSGLTIVAVAALSRLQSDLEKYRLYLLNALSVMAFLGMGISALLALVGRDLILAVLGQRWAEAGLIFTIFAPGIGMMLLYCTYVWIHLSIGRADRCLRWGIFDLAVTAAALAMGLHWGAEGVATAWVVSYWAMTLPALWYAGRPIGFGIAPVIRVVWRYIVAAALSYGGAAFLFRLLPRMGAETGSLWAAARVVAASILFTGVYLLAVIGVHGSFDPLRRVIGLLREMLLRRRPGQADPDQAMARAELADTGTL